MRGARAMRAAASAARAVVVVAALVLAGGAPRAVAQEYDEYADFVPDSVFEATPRSPVSYSSIYQRDQARGQWMQNVGYFRNVGRFSINLDGGTSASDDLQGIESKSSSGDIFGTVRWRATSALVLALDGRYSMSSVSDGTRGSGTDQRRNRLGMRAQYAWSPLRDIGFQFLGSTEFQRNDDLQLVNRDIAGRPDSLNPSPPDVLFASRDSADVSSRLDTARGQVRWSLSKAFVFTGVASASRMTTTSYWSRDSVMTPADGSTVISTHRDSSEVRPSDNLLLDGGLVYTGSRGMTASLRSKRSDFENVYFDLGRNALEFYVSQTRHHSFEVQSGARLPVVLQVTGSLKRSLTDSDTRASSSRLVTAREVGAVVSYVKRNTFASTNFTVNRTRADREATTSDLVVTRTTGANLRQRLTGRLWFEGRGTASLYSYQYPIVAEDLKSDPNRTYSPLDRDVANAFGSLGLRFAVTPRCSTAANFSASRTHDVSIDAERSAGNVATTVYQINGLLRMPLSRDIGISQDYVLTSTYRIFDYGEERNDLSRNFRIDTAITDTLLPVAYLSLAHRYTFLDRGEFTPEPSDPGGARFYRVGLEQFQHVLSGTVGIRPAPGILLVATQSLADTRIHDLANENRNTTQQWNLSLGLEVNRSFWDGASLIGAVRHESKYQNLSTRTDSTNREDHWIAGVTFQKEF